MKTGNRMASNVLALLGMVLLALQLLTKSTYPSVIYRYLMPLGLFLVLGAGVLRLLVYLRPGEEGKSLRNLFVGVFLVLFSILYLFLILR